MRGMYYEVRYDYVVCLLAIILLRSDVGFPAA